MDFEEVNEETLKRDFPDSYKSPNYQVVEDSDWDNWSQSIEIKLSNQGKMILGLGAGVLITLMLTVLQGKVVITLVKAHKEVVDVLNTLTGVVGDGTNAANRVSTDYTKPQGRIDESKIDPIDLETAEELRIRMEASTKNTEEGIL